MSTDQQDAAKTRVEQHRLYESRLFAGLPPAYKVLLCNALGDDTFKIGRWSEEKLRLKDAQDQDKGEKILEDIDKFKATLQAQVQDPSSVESTEQTVECAENITKAGPYQLKSSHKDLSSIRYLVNTYNCTFFDIETFEPLHTSNAVGKIGVDYRHHMDCWTLILTDHVVPIEEVTDDEARALADNGESKFKSSDGTADETSWAQNTDGAVDTVEGSKKRKSRNVPADFDPVAKSTKVMAFINYAAHNAVRLVVQDPSNTNISEKYKEEMKKWCPEMHAAIKHAQSKNHGVALVVEMIFNPREAVSEKIDMGTPCFATKFAESVKKGRLIVVIHGHDRTDPTAHQFHQTIGV